MHFSIPLNNRHPMAFRTDRGNGVGDDAIAAFAAQLGASVTQKLLRFQGEADDVLAGAAPSAQCGQDIGIAGQLDGHAGGRAAFLDFLPSQSGRTVIGDRGGHDDDVRGAGGAQAGAIHLTRGDHLLYVDAARHAQCGRATHERDVRTVRVRHARQCVAELARRTVRHKSHRIDHFPRRSGADQDTIRRQTAHAITLTMGSQRDAI